MRARLTIALLASLTLSFACQKHADTTERGNGTAQTPADAVEPAGSAKTGTAETPPPGSPTTPTPLPPSQPPEADQPAARDPVDGDPNRPQVVTNGTAPAPGGCARDSECPKGQVCEACGGPGQCTPGCHRDDQCAAGEHCAQVQCIRCPCPGQCEAGPAEEGRGKL